MYVLAMLLVLGRATYDPAQTAYLPRVCDDDELLTANADLRRLVGFDGDRWIAGFVIAMASRPA